MQCTLPNPQLATPSESIEAASNPTSQRAVTSSELLAAFASVADPRRRQGTRFKLPAILALATVAILSNHLSVLAIAEWGVGQGHTLLESLGFANGVTPHQSTLQRLFCKLNPDALSIALSAYFGRSESARTKPRPRGSQGVSLDGKAQRGRLAFDSSGCPVHALAAYLHDNGIVLAQEPIDTQAQIAQTQVDSDATQSKPIDKGEAELTVAPDLIKRIDWQGRVLTGDALLCQRNLCELVVNLGGDYLFIVKANQPTLYEDIRLLFDPPTQCLPLDDCREASTVDNGHGRHNDTRHLIASTDLVGYTDWPYLAQVFRVQRTWQEGGESKCKIQYGITSLPPPIADARRLLGFKRGHWQIENCDHYVKDVTMGEDRSSVHSGNGPSVMAMLRDLALSLLHQAGVRAIASRLRHNSTNPEAALALLTSTPDQNA